MFKYLMTILLLAFQSAAFAAEEPPPPGEAPSYHGRSFDRTGEPGPGYGKHGGGRVKGGPPCYSGSRADNYGACKPVLTVEDAVKRIKESSKENITVDRVVERTWFFKADILDKDGKLLDKVIIHKRSGRIRSIL